MTPRDPRSPEALRYAAIGRFTVELGLAGFVWQGVIGYRELDGDRLVKLEISTRGRVDHFEGIELTILALRTGALDERWFDFDEVGMQRGDDRPDRPEAPFVLWAHGSEFDWHIARPADLAPLRHAIDDHIRWWHLDPVKRVMGAFDAQPRADAREANARRPRRPGGKR